MRTTSEPFVAPVSAEMPALVLPSLGTGDVDPPPDQLRALAIRTDGTSGDDVDLAGVWRALIDRRETVLDHFSSGDRDYLVLRQATRTVRRRAPVKAEVLERILLGHSQKLIAIERRLAPSTIAVTASETLRAIGLCLPTSRAPFSLSLLVHAYRGVSAVHQGRGSELPGSLGLRVVSVPRLDVLVGGVLTRSEFAVLRLRLEGWTHAEIARGRRSSLRTVANQVAAAFRKLGVSGRSELLAFIARGTAPGLPPHGGEPARCHGECATPLGSCPLPCS